MSTSKSSTKSDTPSTISEPAFCTRSSSMRKTPLKDITNNVLGNIGGTTIDFCSQDSIVFSNESAFSDFSIDSFLSQFDMKESTLLSDFIGNDLNLYGSSKFTKKSKSISALSPQYLKRKNTDWNRFFMLRQCTSQTLLTSCTRESLLH